MKTFWITILLLGMLPTLYASAAGADDRNMAPNPSFESPPAIQGTAVPDGWSFFTTQVNGATLSRQTKHSGEQSLRLATQKIPKMFQGLTFSRAVSGEKKYVFSVYTISDKTDPFGGSAYMSLIIEWKRADGTEISRSISKIVDAGLSRLRWEIVALDGVVAPKGAVQAVFGIHLNDGPTGGKGAVLIDDVRIEELGTSPETTGDFAHSNQFKLHRPTQPESHDRSPAR
jgi:hypothetical protein